MCRVDERHVLGSDFLNSVVERYAFAPIWFLARPHIKAVYFGFPVRRWRVRSGSEADDRGLPVIGTCQPGNKVAELDQSEIRLDADLLETLLDDRSNLFMHAVLGVGY